MHSVQCLQNSSQQPRDPGSKCCYIHTAAAEACLSGAKLHHSARQPRLVDGRHAAALLPCLCLATLRLPSVLVDRILPGLRGVACAALCRADALKEQELPVLRRKVADLQAEVVQLEGRESELADCVVAVSLDAKV